MKTIILITLLAALTGCASNDTDLTERVYAPQIVTGWKDSEGHIHLKGEGGEDGHAVITEPRQQWSPLGWGGASR